MIGYHVTEKTKLSSIQSEGLIPKIGERSQELGESIERIYFFRDMDSVQNALWNWLGEWFEDKDEDGDLELVILKVDLSGFKVEEEAFELTVTEKIHPDRILEIIPES